MIEVDTVADMLDEIENERLYQALLTVPFAEEYEEMFQERLKQKRAKEQKTV